MERILPGDLLFSIVVDVSDYGHRIRIVPRWEIAGNLGEAEIGVWEEGEWKRVKVNLNELVVNQDIPPILTIPRKWGEILRDELIKQLGDKKKDASEQELEATKYHLEDMRSLVFKHLKVK